MRKRLLEWRVLWFLRLAQRHESLIPTRLECLVVFVGNFKELLAPFVENAHISEIVFECAHRKLGYLSQRIEVLLGIEAGLFAFQRGRVVVCIAGLSNRRGLICKLGHNPSAWLRLYFSSGFNHGVSSLTIINIAQLRIGLLKLLEIKQRVGVGVDRLGGRLRCLANFLVLFPHDFCYSLLHHDSLFSHTKSIKKIKRDAKP